jgi:hypothetical protein
LKLFNSLALRVPMILIFFVSFSYAKYFYYDDYILHQPFTQQIERLGSEVYEKTNWSVYAVVVKDINISAPSDKAKLFAYEKEIVPKLKEPYVLYILAIDQMKVHITGSKGFEKLFNPNSLLEEYVYPILGSKIKTDVRQKYLAVILNGYGQIADEIAQYHNVKLDNSIGNSNKTTLNVIRIIFYGIIVGALVIYIYRRYIKRRV